MHSIKDLSEKIKGYQGFKVENWRTIQGDLFLVIIIVLVAFGSFGLGRLSKIEGSKTPVRFENVPEVTSETFSGKSEKITQENLATSIGNSGGELVGSKNGTKYYYSWCTGVQKISPANLIHFADKAEAEARGYTASATCKGL